MPKLIKCIYCPEIIDPLKGKGDHVLPKVFGEFAEDPHFRRICPACNKEIGKSEQQMVVTGPEGHWREFYWPLDPERPTTPRISYGAPARKSIVDDEFMKGGLKVKMVEPGKFDSTEHLNVHLKDSTHKVIDLVPSITLSSLKKKLSGLEFSQIEGIYINSHQENKEHYFGLLFKLFPAYKFMTERQVPAGECILTGCHIFSTKDLRYFRALAKIAFHCYLTRTGRFGDEDCFSAIKKYIMSGWDKSEYYPKGHIHFPIPKFETNKWHHLVGFMEQGNGTITGFVSLSRGPDNPFPDKYYIHLGKLPRRIIGQDYKRIYAYIYEPVEESPTKAGRVSTIY
jgi:hypothetical protein